MTTGAAKAALLSVLVGGFCAATGVAQEQHRVVVEPGGEYGPIIFRAERDAPTWRLTVDVGPPNCIHVEGSQRPNNAIWQAYFEARTGYFESDTSIHASELQFQRDFTGDLSCGGKGGSGGSGGGGGVGGAGGRHVPSWIIHAQTEDNYYVVESEETVCAGESVTFRAIDGLGNAVKSDWSAAPSLGKLPKGASVTIKDPDVGAYLITATATGEDGGTDTAQLNVTEIARVVITAGGAGNSDANGADNPVDVTFDAEVTFSVEMAPNDSGGEGTEWSVTTIKDNGKDGATVDIGAGRTVTRAFTEPGTARVTAECGSGSASIFARLATGTTPGDDDDDDGMIEICHRPPGNPENAHTIRVAETALKAHLAHGDSIGPCEP